MTAAIPCMEPDYLEHTSQRYSEFISKILHGEISGFVHLPAQADHFFGKFVVSDLLTIKLPSFLDFVIHILSPCSKPKMLWINAVWIVSAWTVMKNTQPVRNWTNINNPRGSGRNYYLAPPTIDTPIVSALCGTVPKPTGIGFIYLSPEPFWKRLGKTLRSQIISRNIDHSCVSNAVRVTGPAAFLVVNPTKRSKAVSNA